MAVTGSGEEPFLTWLNGDGAPADIDDPGLRRRRRRRGHCESYAQDSYSSASAHPGKPLMGGNRFARADHREANPERTDRPPDRSARA